jgi:hypothetical protein
MNYEQLVERCKELRARHERARSEFFLFLMQVESEHEETWKAAGVESFDQFVECHKLCQVHLYRLFVAGCNREGSEKALTNGAAWTIEMGRLRQPTPELSKEMGKRADSFIEVNHVPPSEQTVERWRLELDKAPASEHGTVRKASELHRLRAENQMLLAQNKKLEKENTKLRSELEKLTKKAA